MLVSYVAPAAVTATAATPPSWVEAIRALAWPVVALFGVLVVALSGTLRNWLVDLVKKIRKVSAFGVDLELTPEAAAEVKELTALAFGELRLRVNAEFDRLVYVHQINDKRNRLIDSVVRPLLAKHGVVPNFRSTIYVEDVLFSETMYQLLDYYPKAHGPRGRRFPIRYGIIGRAWRSHRDQIEPEVPVDPQQLIRDWGMTLEQASSAGFDRRSFACILSLDDVNGRVCLVYLDSPDPAAFGETQERYAELSQKVSAGATACGLTASIAALTTELRNKSPFIAIYDEG